MRCWLFERRCRHRTVTPFELFFGRRYNPLRDYHQLLINWDATASGVEAQQQLDEELELAVMQRTQLMKWQLDIQRQARETVEERAGQQKTQQDASRTRVTGERIADGARVWMVNENRGHKLGHRFVGPYTVVRSVGTEGSANYIIRDGAGQQHRRSVAREKLYVDVNQAWSQRQADLFCKEDMVDVATRLDNRMPGPVSTLDTQVFTVERVLAWRGKRDARQALVKWDGYPVAEWVAEGLVPVDFLVDEAADGGTSGAGGRGEPGGEGQE